MSTDSDRQRIKSIFKVDVDVNFYFISKTFGFVYPLVNYLFDFQSTCSMFCDNFKNFSAPVICVKKTEILTFKVMNRILGKKF